MSDIDVRVLQLINAKSISLIDETQIEITPPKAITPKMETNGVEVNTSILITARPEGKYKGSKTVRYRRNTLAMEFAGYGTFNPTSTRPLWKNMIYTEMVELIEDFLGLYCIAVSDVDMGSFAHLFPANSRGHKQLDLTKVVNGKLTVPLNPTPDNYYYNGGASLVFSVTDERVYW